MSCKTGTVIGECHARHRAIEFRRFLDTIDTAVPPDRDVHLILDNHATHKTAPVRRWFARHLRFHVHFTPTSASWLNLVERWFATLTEKPITRGAHRSTRALETAIREYLTIRNQAPKPFVWHKTADEILASVARYCQRISDSGHWRSWRGQISLWETWPGLRGQIGHRSYRDSREMGQPGARLVRHSLPNATADAVINP